MVSTLCLTVSIPVLSDAMKTFAELAALNRRDLQKLAVANGIKGNQKVSSLCAGVPNCSDRSCACLTVYFLKLHSLRC